jgi:hypothetical protein
LNLAGKMGGPGPPSFIWRAGPALIHGKEQSGAAVLDFFLASG